MAYFDSVIFALFLGWCIPGRGVNFANHLCIFFCSLINITRALIVLHWYYARKLYTRRNKGNSIILKHGAHSYWLYASQKCAENSVYITIFQLLMRKFSRHYLLYKSIFTCRLIWTSYYLRNEESIRSFQRFSFQLS